jgi:hypothetical protein
LFHLFADLGRGLVQGVQVFVFKQQRYLHEAVVLMPFVPVAVVAVFLLFMRMIVFVFHKTPRNIFRRTSAQI